MFRDIATVLTQSIDEITRRWVEALRTSERTEVHKQLLTAEIVDGMKGILSNLAQTIEARESPEGEEFDLLTGETTPGEPDPPDPAEDTARTTITNPLNGPLARAQSAASALGKLRHKQHYEIGEVVFEYVKLRQEIWAALRSELPDTTLWPPNVVAYVDRLLDELMLVALDSFYDTSVRTLEQRAIGDTTTQLYNKDFFRQRLNEELRRAVRNGQPIAIVMIDLDNLKQINDTYGHPVGDEALKAVASAIRHTCRQSDVPCRYGGDEFVVILPETNKEQARAFASRVMGAVQSLSILVVPAEGQREHASAGEAARITSTLADEDIVGKSPLFAPSPTVSIGLASFPEDARNPETLLAKADDALYRAKNEGRNRVMS